MKIKYKINTTNKFIHKMSLVSTYMAVFRRTLQITIGRKIVKTSLHILNNHRNLYYISTWVHLGWISQNTQFLGKQDTHPDPRCVHLSHKWRQTCELHSNIFIILWNSAVSATYRTWKLYWNGVENPYFLITGHPP